MLTLFDYLPSQNAWKVRLLLNHLQRPYRSEIVSIFEGHGQHDDYRRINSSGTVPAIRLDDGRVLAESNAILAYLADGTPYLPGDAFARARVLQWLSFEQNHVESQIGSLRYWTMTGKLAQRPTQRVEGKRAASMEALRILDDEFARRDFIAGGQYTIADMSLFAYSSRAEDAGLALSPYPHFRGWIGRVQAQAGFLATVHPYSIDPHFTNELP